MKYTLIRPDIQVLIDKGQYDEALQKIQDFDQEFIAEALYLKSKVYREQAKFEEAIQSSLKALAIAGNANNQLLKYLIHVEKIRIQWLNGSIDESLNELRQVETSLFQSTNNMNNSDIHQIHGLMHFIKSNLYLDKGEVDDALVYQLQAIDTLSKIADEVNIERELAFAYNDLAKIYYAKSDIKQAEENVLKSLELKREIGNPNDIGYSLNLLGSIYYTKGEIDNALHTFNECLRILKYTGNPLDIAHAIQTVGDIHLLMENYKDAETNYISSLSLRREYNNPLAIAHSLVSLIQLYLKTRNKSEANKYLVQLKIIASDSESSFFTLYYKFAKALTLKHVRRAAPKLKAAEIFKEIIEDNIIDVNVTLSAMNHLCELLLLEYFSLNNLEIFEEAKKLAQKMVTIAYRQQLFGRIVQVLFIKAKFEAIEGANEEALLTLHEAENLAQEKGLISLNNRIHKEIRNFNSNIDFWRSKVEFTERLDESRITEYLDSVSDIINFSGET